MRSWYVSGKGAQYQGSRRHREKTTARMFFTRVIFSRAASSRSATLGSVSPARRAWGSWPKAALPPLPSCFRLCDRFAGDPSDAQSASEPWNWASSTHSSRRRSWAR